MSEPLRGGYRGGPRPPAKELLPPPAPRVEKPEDPLHLGPMITHAPLRPDSYLNESLERIWKRLSNLEAAVFAERASPVPQPVPVDKELAELRRLERLIPQIVQNTVIDLLNHEQDIIRLTRTFEGDFAAELREIAARNVAEAKAELSADYADFADEGK